MVKELIFVSPNYWLFFLQCSLKCGHYYMLQVSHDNYLLTLATLNVQGDVSRPSLYFSSDNHLVNSYTYEPTKNIDKESRYVPSLEEVIRRKKTSQHDREYYDYYSDNESEEDDFDSAPTRRLSLSESVGGSFIQNKLSHLRNVLWRVDDTLDAVFTLLVPGKSKS